MDDKQTMQVHRVLGECGAAGHGHAAKYPLGEVKLSVSLWPLRGKNWNTSRKSAPWNALSIAQNPQTDSFHAFDINRTGDQFGKGRQTFLGRRYSRRITCQRFEIGLFATIERGQRMHEGFVFQQLVPVIFGEAGVITQTNSGRTCSRFRDQIRIQFDIHFVMDEKPVQSILQLKFYGFG